MDRPLLTIVTVTFNAERYLGRTLQSVRNALKVLTKPYLIEYLIIDGKSRDETLKIAGGYEDVVSKIVSEKDSGLYDAMNKGLRLSTGKYIWFLNAGDEMRDPNVLSNLLPALEKGDDVYYSDAMMVREDGSEIGLRSVATPHKLPANLKWQDFALGMKVCHQAFIVRKDIAPLYDDTNLSADIGWEIDCLKVATRTTFLPFVLCNYLTGGLSVQNHRRSLIDRFAVLRKHFGLPATVINHILITLRGFLFRFQKGKYW
ncbi:glycosyltransferase family 2 protein [Dyadobacter luticola]|uniref:Glycosyltransferase n=1 Tax=Dyadobacter luticola TaxID=1979387 RepID=A0A5R9KXS1_9BACT|nr:glycosyltransferase family 2 protein [Dyadobacter luticola]TLV00948.1 glycosyltransferase [Dyadobacter luticola]